MMEKELMQNKQGIANLQHKLAETGADRGRVLGNLRRKEEQLKQGRNTVSDMAGRHLAEMSHETKEVARYREEVRTLTDEVAASKGALWTKAQVRVQAEVQSDQDKQIKELVARVNELEGGRRSASVGSASSRASSAVTSDCESSDWSEWQCDDHDYFYEEREEEEQSDKDVPCEGAGETEGQRKTTNATEAVDSTPYGKR